MFSYAHLDSLWPDTSQLTLIIAVKVSKVIQVAECSHNTRASGQTFAVFRQDHQYDGNHRFPYGTCEAYNFASGASTVRGSDYWAFF
ncbi:hypothetical protein GQ44DRAFT_705769 [Phaeosphaeriaceae sp. PMI808]|nr:hypothetical protein GQ44DRAFT_705769 [Phaeosphaeriaceae sp. PMI808]